MPADAVEQGPARLETAFPRSPGGAARLLHLRRVDTYKVDPAAGDIQGIAVDHLRPADDPFGRERVDLGRRGRRASDQGTQGGRHYRAERPEFGRGGDIRALHRRINT